MSQSCSPPIFPMARKVEAEIMSKLPQPVAPWLKRGFPRFSLKLGELPQEESSGFGLGCCLLLLGLIANAVLNLQRIPLMFPTPGAVIGLAALISTLAFMAKLGSESTARLLGPYYPFWILLLVLVPGAAALHQRRWWKIISLTSVASTVLVILLNPSRPLLPMEHLLAAVTQRVPDNAQLERARTVYAVYRERHDMLQRLRNHLPMEAKRIAMLGDLDDSELSLWMPYGQRRAFHVTERELREPMSHDFEWLVLKTKALQPSGADPVGSLLSFLRGEIVGREMITSKVSAGPEEWLVIRLPKARGVPPAA
jgi:hypothetical protein